MNYKLTKRKLKYPQIDASFRYIYDNYNYFPEYSNGILRDVIEFGVYKCGSLRKICSYLKNNGWYYPYVYGIDSWSGLPANNSEFAKFTAGSYKAKKPNQYRLRNAFDYQQLYLINRKFEDLCEDDTELISKCLLIHIDSDIYQSAKTALTWCFDNKLVGRHTLIAFDEYKVGKKCAGEQLAWLETREKYNFDTEEIFHSIYYDKDTNLKVRQCVWEILEI